jgi:hypothetical protein
MYRSLRSLIRRCVWLGLGLALPLVALAEEPRAFAAISLVADELRIVGQQGTTGTALNQNEVVKIALNFDLIEAHALRAVTEAILKADASATVAPVKLTDARYYASQSTFVQGERAALPDDLLRTLRNGRVSHLVLLNKHRADARMNSGLQTFGSGRVEGLGYYVDHEARIREVGRAEVASGFLSPYVYVRLSVIDVASLAVLDSRTVVATQVLTAIGTKAGRDPWEVLDATQKIETLKQMIHNEVQDLVPKVLQGIKK